MSRIHEALKRAEQERALQKSAAAPVERPETERTLPQPSDEPRPLQGAVPLVPSFPAAAFRAEPVSVETLLTGCKQPEWNPNGDTLFFGKEENHSYKTEVFRTLRSRLYRLRDQISLRTLLITSALPAEGKSFIAANLSQAMARQHGRRVLLIDADLRAPRLHMLLGAPKNPGLTEYLSGEADEISAIQRGPGDDLFFLPCGSNVANPVELIANGKMKELLERLKGTFDWIVLDSPPMAPVSDASLLADMCDGALLVVRAATTPFDLAQKACAEFKTTPLLGAVLNGFDRHSGYGSYYYSYYGLATDGREG